MSDELWKRIPSWFFAAGFFLAMVVVGYQVLWRGQSLNCGSDWLPADCETPNEGSGIPSGAVIAFLSSETEPCPGDEWELFNDAKGRFIVGAGPSVEEGLSTKILSQTGGAEGRRLGVDELPEHNHIPQFTESGQTEDTRGIVTMLLDTQDNKKFQSYDLGKDGGGARFSLGFALPENVGKGHAFDTMPPYIALYFCKKK